MKNSGMNSKFFAEKKLVLEFHFSSNSINFSMNNLKYFQKDDPNTFNKFTLIHSLKENTYYFKCVYSGICQY